MIKPVMLCACLAASLLPLGASVQGASILDERRYTEGPVTEVNYIHIEYGHFDDYMAWLDSTWEPTMEAMKKAGLIIDYKVFQATAKSPDQPDIIFFRTFKNWAALDRDAEQDEVARQVICSTECQNKARVGRNEYRKVLGIEYIRELNLK